MKKIFPIVATVMLSGLIIIASCKKKDENPVGNWTCKCTYVVGGTTLTQDVPYTSTAKNTASASCTSTQSALITAGATSATCTLN